MKKVEAALRTKELIRCATEVFCTYGYKQTQMTDIAKAMGVATGTLYLYVESKEALFDFVVRYGIENNAEQTSITFPVTTPKTGSTISFLKKILSEQVQWPNLTEALTTTQVENPRQELLDIIQELYSLMLSKRWGLFLIARSSVDFPELSEVFINKLRKNLLKDLTKYIKYRVEAKQFFAVVNPNISAIFLSETIVWAVIHRMCDPEFRLLSEEQLNATVVTALANSFISPLST
ncbi:MAG: TetR/AcrR family transcriptional regulator [Blastocatellia bacterium]